MGPGLARGYATATSDMGGKEVLEKNVLLFMIPGMDHCGVLPGPNGISQDNLNVLEAIEDWVEQQCH